MNEPVNRGWLRRRWLVPAAVLIAGATAWMGLASSGTAAPAPSADLSVALSDSPDPVATGAALTYTAEVANAGPDDATNVVLTDRVPGRADFRSVNSSQGTCTGPQGGTITCRLGTLASGARPAKVRIALRAPAKAGGISDSARITSDVRDPSRTNNTASESTLVAGRSADLSVALSDSPDPVAPGAALAYFAEVANAGPDDATNVVLTDRIPSAADFRAVRSSQGHCTRPHGGRITCRLGTLASAGRTAKVKIRLKAPGKPRSISNSARVTSDLRDPNRANNSASETTRVAAVPAPTCKGQRATIVGSDGPDTLEGGSGADVVTALAGDDTIRAKGGNDLVCAGGGGDVVGAGGGDDRVYAKRGHDRIRGRSGDDLLRGGRAADKMRGGSGADVIRGGPGRDVLRGGGGDDVLIGGPGDDKCLGGGGKDTRRGC